MPKLSPRTRFTKGPAAAGLAVLLALAGCKSDSNTRSSDPLVKGPRIPPQNMPLPDSGIGNNGKDPLLGTPTRAPDKTGVGYTDDPSRFKGTYLPGPNSTPAALVMGNSKDGDGLKIDGNENRAPLQPTGGVLPPQPPGEAGAGTALDSLYGELAHYGCTPADRSMVAENGKYTFRAAVLRAGTNGAKVQYTEVGATPEEAVRQVLEAIVADRK